MRAKLYLPSFEDCGPPVSEIQSERWGISVPRTRIFENQAFSGAWTQDDKLLRRSSGLVAVGWIRGKLKLERRQSIDYIAGDFASPKTQANLL